MNKGRLHYVQYLLLPTHYTLRRSKIYIRVTNWNWHLGIWNDF